MLITLIINPTTGKEFTIEIDNGTTVEELKKILAKKLKVGKEVISLLYMNGLLTTGTLASHELVTGSTLRLVPCIETGILTPRPEQSVLEALESLNENQVSDFLTGKSPLNLTMRLGEHVMLIQLQLSKGTPSSSSSSFPTPSPPIVSISKASTDSSSPSTSSSSSTNTPTSSTNSTNSPSTSNTTSNTSSSSSYNSSESGSKPNLSEASRSLTNTLKKLSKVTKEDDLSKHMHHHGKGIYSGTFSGTLNPILQDSGGKPKKHVSTIVHILNDLLGGVDLKWGNSPSTSSTTNSTSSTSSSKSSTNNSTTNESSTTNSNKRKSPSPSSSPPPEKRGREETNREEVSSLKTKVDKLLTELQMRRRERLQRHNISS